MCHMTSAANQTTGLKTFAVRTQSDQTENNKQKGKTNVTICDILNFNLKSIQSSSTWNSFLLKIKLQSCFFTDGHSNSYNNNNNKNNNSLGCSDPVAIN